MQALARLLQNYMSHAPKCLLGAVYGSQETRFNLSNTY